jgi:hypothetical protein
MKLRRCFLFLLLILTSLLMTSCATWDFGIVKIPAVLGEIAILFAVVYFVFNHYSKK